MDEVIYAIATTLSQPNLEENDVKNFYEILEPLEKHWNELLKKAKDIDMNIDEYSKEMEELKTKFLNDIRKYFKSDEIECRMQ